MTSPGLVENRKKKTGDNIISGSVTLLFNHREKQFDACFVWATFYGCFSKVVGVDTRMSVLMKLFGSGGKSGKQPTPQEAIQRLRETEEMLTKKQEFLEKKIDQELLTAKKNGTKNKRGTGKLLDVLVWARQPNMLLLRRKRTWLR